MIKLREENEELDEKFNEFNDKYKFKKKKKIKYYEILKNKYNYFNS